MPLSRSRKAVRPSRRATRDNILPRSCSTIMSTSRGRRAGREDRRAPRAAVSDQSDVDVSNDSGSWGSNSDVADSDFQPNANYGVIGRADKFSWDEDEDEEEDDDDDDGDEDSEVDINEFGDLLGDLSSYEQEVQRVEADISSTFHNIDDRIDRPLFDGNLNPPEHYQKGIQTLNDDDFQRKEYAKGTERLIKNAENQWQT